MADTMSRLCRGNAPHFCANCGSTFEAKTDEDLLQNAVSPPPASGEVERLLAEKDRQVETIRQLNDTVSRCAIDLLEKDRQIETLTQALAHISTAHLEGESDEAAWLRDCARAALAGASRPTEVEP